MLCTIFIDYCSFPLLVGRWKNSIINELHYLSKQHHLDEYSLRQPPMFLRRSVHVSSRVHCYRLRLSAAILPHLISLILLLSFSSWLFTLSRFKHTKPNGAQKQQFWANLNSLWSVTVHIWTTKWHMSNGMIQHCWISNNNFEENLEFIFLLVEPLPKTQLFSVKEARDNDIIDYLGTGPTSWNMFIYIFSDDSWWRY